VVPELEDETPYLIAHYL